METKPINPTDYYWVAINEASVTACLTVPMPVSRIKCSPTPQLLLGYLTPADALTAQEFLRDHELAEVQQYLASGRHPKVPMWSSSKKPAHPEPPTRRATIWGNQLEEDGFAEAVSQTMEARIFFVFTKDEVLSCDYSRFFTGFDFGSLDSDVLRQMQGGFYLAVDGWNDDPRELVEIPEARKFFQGLHEVFPAWFYFFHPYWIRAMMPCLYDGAVVRIDGQPKVRRRFSTKDLNDFLAEQFPLLTRLGERAGMTDDEIDRISRNILEKLNLKFEPKDGSPDRG